MPRLTQNTVLNVKNHSHTITAELVIPEVGTKGSFVAQAGRCVKVPMTSDYPSLHPWVLIDSKIYKVIVDVSGESYVDLEMAAEEAVAAMMAADDD